MTNGMRRVLRAGAALLVAGGLATCADEPVGEVDPMIGIEQRLRALEVEAPLVPVPEWPGDPIQMVEIPGARAELIWRDLRDRAAETGVWPLIVAGRIDLICEVAGFAVEDGLTPSEVLEEASNVDLEIWLRSRRADLEDPDDDGWLEEHLAFDPAWHPEGDFVNIDVLGGHRGDETYHDVVSLWLVPCKQGWEVPAHLFLGAWNEVPESHRLVAVLRSWKERFGADLFSIASDRMEFDVTRPPTDRAVVEALAVEQYLVCNDVVDQGYEEISRLASGLAGARAWWFWWD